MYDITCCESGTMECQRKNGSANNISLQRSNTTFKLVGVSLEMEAVGAKCIIMSFLSSSSLCTAIDTSPPSLLYSSSTFITSHPSSNTSKVMGCFISGNWFKRIIGKKKVKKDRFKQVKVNTVTKKTNGSKWRFLFRKISSILANGASSRAAIHGMGMKDIAAMRIQKAFRVYKARKALRQRRGTVRFQALIENHTIGNQESSTLSHIHFWSKIQGQIRARRVGMVTEGRTRQKKQENQLKLEAKLQDLEVEWCGGSETMEEILARIQEREEAAAKRERAMAYAFSHQWRASSSQYFGQAYYDLGKESWGWSWKERWIAVRPWETRVRVHASPITSKKVQTKPGTKFGKTANNPGIKVLVSVKPNSSIGRGTTKERKFSNSSAEKEAPQEANTET